jgi:hypothetical protein
MTIYLRAVVGRALGINPMDRLSGEPLRRGLYHMEIRCSGIAAGGKDRHPNHSLPRKGLNEPAAPRII